MSDPAIEAALYAAQPANEGTPIAVPTPAPEVTLEPADLWHLREINTRFEALALRRQVFRLEQQVAEAALQDLSQRLLAERDECLRDVAARYGVDPRVRVDLESGRLLPPRELPPQKNEQ